MKRIASIRWSVFFVIVLLLVGCRPATPVLAPPTSADKLMVLSFDDGPNTVTTPLVLDVLEKYGVTASFFVEGQNINDASAEVMKRAFDMGCTIENHSWTHSHMSELPIDSAAWEITATSARVAEVIGVEPQFFRPPFIDASEAMHDSIALPFICGDSSEDWQADLDVNGRVHNILSRSTDGSIILMHDFVGNTRTVETLDSIIPLLMAQGVRFVTVPELFRLRGITPEPHSGIVWNRVPTRETPACEKIWTRVDVETFAQVIADSTVTLIDVRRPDEYEEGHISGALNINVLEPDFLRQTMAAVPSTRTVALYCRSGRRSQTAARRLAANGYVVVELESGWLGWTESGKNE